MDFLFASSGTSILRYGKIKISSKECKNHRNNALISIAYYEILRPNCFFYLLFANNHSMHCRNELCGNLFILMCKMCFSFSSLKINYVLQRLFLKTPFI